MAMTDGLPAATASTRPAIVSRGHGHGPSASSERRSMSTTTIGAPSGFDRRSCRSAASTMSKAFSRNTLRHSLGINEIAATNSTSARIPAITPEWVLPIWLSMRSVDFGELERVAEDSIQRPADRSNLFQLAERLIDLGTAGAKQQCQLALRHAQFQRQSLSRRRLAITKGHQEETRQANVHRVKCDRLKLPAGVAQPAAKERYQP